IGILLVPVGHLLPDNYVNTLRSLAGIFGDLALVVIMYNGGKAIVLNQKLLNDRKGISLGILDTLLPMAVLAILMTAFGWPLIYGALLGAILGETSTIIVIPILRKIKMPDEMYTALVMETTLNSVFAILLFTLLLSFTNGQPLSASNFANFVVDYVSVAVAFGLVAGLLWLAVQSYIKGAREYLASLAFAILLYGVVDLFNGAAAISVLIFAIILGNYKPITERLGLKIDIKKKERRETHAVERDLEFLIITFFFVFIGMIALLSIQYLIYAMVVTIVLVTIRYAEVVFILDGDRIYRDTAFALMQRGTVVAVLAAILFSIGGSYFDQIFYICFMVIILTNIIASILVSRTKLEVRQ
ncbi:MAG: cation:proton antiporter, partial [Candidatus Micrarchaeota archaeon]|nr:cation:proton antiporter [Candidatus Micrarchaeota archaeon]